MGVEKDNQKNNGTGMHTEDSMPGTVRWEEKKNVEGRVSCTVGAGRNVEGKKTGVPLKRETSGRCIRGPGKRKAALLFRVGGKK